MEADTLTPTADGSRQSEGHAVPEKALSVWERLPEHLSWREKVAYLGVGFAEGPQVECPIEHVFGHGLYIRKMKIPAGTLFLGRPHRHGHEVTLLKGSVILITEAGKRQVDATTTVHTSPGYCMVVATLTDIEAQTVHANPGNSEDLDALELDAFEPADSMHELGMRVAGQMELA